MLDALQARVGEAHHRGRSRTTATRGRIGRSRRASRSAPSSSPTSSRRPGASRVLTIDLHAGQIQGFFNIPVDNVYATPVLLQYLRERLGDARRRSSRPTPAASSARARSRSASTRASRSSTSGAAGPNDVAEMQIIGDVDARAAVIVDDMVDTAGTLCAGGRGGASRRAPRRCSRARTHPVLSGPAIERLEASAHRRARRHRHDPAAEQARRVSQDPRAVGRAAARRGHPAHPRRGVDQLAVRREGSEAWKRSKSPSRRRADTGKGAGRRLRASGKVPGILYGPKRTTTSDRRRRARSSSASSRTSRART